MYDVIYYFIYKTNQNVKKIIYECFEYEITGSL